MEEWARSLGSALRILFERCPRLVTACYWAGTSAIALEELGHRRSFDLDFHTFHALMDVRPLLTEIQARFPGEFELTSAPDEFGSGFRGLLLLPTGEKVTIEVLSNYQNPSAEDLTESTLMPGMKRVSIGRYLLDKMQCVGERAEARDLVDLHAVLKARPELSRSAQEYLDAQDAIVFTERLLSWTDDAIVRDLRAYEDADPADAKRMRDTLLEWLREKKAG
jgi:hypothetical protein